MNMKRLVVIGMLLLVSGVLAAESAYVSSYRCGLQAAARGDSARLGELSRGTQVVLLAVEGSWARVSCAAGEGWVLRLFLQSTPPGERVSVFGSASTSARIHARTRASADVTAASARGLLDDAGAAGEGRTRGVGGGTDNAQQQQLMRIESLFISDDDLLAFLKAGGIRQ